MRLAAKTIKICSYILALRQHFLMKELTLWHSSSKASLSGFFFFITKPKCHPALVKPQFSNPFLFSAKVMQYH